MSDTLIKNVSDTAFWVAYYRAKEGERADALFHDPLAGKLAGEQGKKIAVSMPGAFMTGWMIAIRTCIIDDFIRSAIHQGIDLVLNLGAGLDTRPYRMDLPRSLVWIEADYPRVIELKERQLSNDQPHCQLERVKLDLASLDERRKFFDRVNAKGKKILVLTEGVVPYLNVEEVGSLADDLKQLNHVCFWIVDYFSPEAMKFRQRRSMKKKMQNAPFKFPPANWFGFFSDHGWCSKEIRYLAEEGERLNRPIPLPQLMKFIFKLRTLFVSQERRAAFRKFAGYVLLEPKIGTPNRN